MISFFDIHQRNFQKVLHSVLIDAHRVLDIGCGIGDYLTQTETSDYVVGIDPHMPYVEKAQSRAPWATVLNSDGITFLEGTSEKFDCILMIDVLEHLNPADSIRLVELAKKHCTGIILSQIPIGIHEQHHDDWNLGGEEWQTHRSTWEDSSVEQLGFDHVFVWKNYYEWDENVVHKSRDTSVAVWSVEKFPLVSVVVPSYNQADWLPKTLDSIIVQTYPFWEAVIVNDGSTDSTKEIIEQYEHRDKRIRGVHKVNGGISSALNSGIEHSKGKYFCWLSSDDLFYPDKLSKQIEIFKTCDQNTAIVFSAFDHIDPNDKITELNLEPPYFEGLEFSQFLKYDYVDGCTIMIPMKIMRELEGFNVQFKHAQDTELWYRLAAKGYTFTYLQEKYTCRRIHPSQGFTDFALDCRFDGFWMVDYYLTHYSFREMFRKVDFLNENERSAVILQMANMLRDPNCNANQPFLFEKYWKWMTDGFLTLPKEIRSDMVIKLIGTFKTKEKEESYCKFLVQKFTHLERAIRNKKETAFSVSKEFHDITRWDKSRDEDFAHRLFLYGNEMMRVGNDSIGINVFKYLSDVPNPCFEAASKEFFRLTFMQGKYDQYIRSFKRKPNFSQLPDTIKATFVWSQLQSGKSSSEIENVVSLISDSGILQAIDQWKQNQFDQLAISEILHWNFRFTEFSIHHMLNVHCRDCHNDFVTSVQLKLSSEPSSAPVLCPHCFVPSIFSDKDLSEYFIRKNDTIVSKQREKKARPSVAIVMRYSNIVGGGVKKMLQHAEWLDQLGCKVTVYSDSPAPTWRKIPGKFVHVRDHYEVPGNIHDAVICMCNYDVPKMLTKYPKENVALFCQGYEGYHVGSTYDELRSDKYFYTAIHSLPIKKFVISSHLVNLFKDKFGSNSYYVPNGVMHSVFYPNLKVQKELNSLVFIGNPNDPLKGLIFLTKTLEEIQKSEFKIEGLTLHIVFGSTGKGSNDKELQINGYSIKYHEGLSSLEIAALINSVEIVVNTSWYEGFSLPVLEALACGTPVITTNNMGAESFCQDGKNAFVVKYGDMNRLGNIIIDLLRHRIEIDTMVHNGLLTAKEYSEDEAARKFIDSYSDFLQIPFDESKKRQLILDVSEKTKKEHQLVSNLHETSPMFTILVPTYNQAQFLPDSLQSLIDQTFTNWEAVVVNDGSTDDTKIVLERFAMFDKRIKIFHKENGGVATALNEALKHAKGNWICWLSSDDLFEPRKLELHKNNIERTPNAKFYYTLYHGLNHLTGQKVKLDRQYGTYMPSKEDQVISFFYTNYINGISICAHRSVFENVGGFNADYRNGQDFDMWLRISEQYPFEFIDEKTCTYRVHPEQGASKFPEAGEYDSCLSCVEYLNRHPYERLFPMIDWDDLNAVSKAIQQTITVAIDPKAFINRLGCGYLLIERLHEWISSRCKTSFRSELLKALRPAIAEVTTSNADKYLKDSFQLLENADTDNYSYRQIDVLMIAKTKIIEKIDGAEKDETAALKKYLERIEKTIIDRDPFVKNIQTITALLEKNQFAEVLRLTNALQLESGRAFNEEVQILRGCAHLGLRDLVQAKNSFEHALEINPKSSEACSGLGEVFYNAEMDKESKTMFEWAVVNNGENITARKGLAKINKALHLRSADNTLLGNTINDLINLAEVKINCGEIDEARTILDKVINLDKYHLDALNDLSVCSIIDNDIQNAVEILSLILTIDPDNEIALENIALLNKRPSEVFNE